MSQNTSPVTGIAPGTTQTDTSGALHYADLPSASGHLARASRWIARVVAAFSAWKSLTREKSELQHLLQDAPPHILNDVGLTRDQVEQALDRLHQDPFWHR